MDLTMDLIDLCYTPPIEYDSTRGYIMGGSTFRILQPTILGHRREYVRWFLDHCLERWMGNSECLPFSSLESKGYETN